MILSSQRLVSKLVHADGHTNDLVQQFLATQASRDASKLLSDSKGDDDVQKAFRLVLKTLYDCSQSKDIFFNLADTYGTFWLLQQGRFFLD